jgi:hypothetical protein
MEPVKGGKGNGKGVQAVELYSRGGKILSRMLVGAGGVRRGP